MNIHVTVLTLDIQEQTVLVCDVDIRHCCFILKYDYHAHMIIKISKNVFRNENVHRDIKKPKTYQQNGCSKLVIESLPHNINSVKSYVIL